MRRFLTEVREPNAWEEEYARIIAFVEREGGVTITEDYPHLKLMNQIKYFQEFRKEEFEIIGKMIGCVK